MPIKIQFSARLSAFSEAVFLFILAGREMKCWLCVLMRETQVHVNLKIVLRFHTFPNLPALANTFDNLDI